MSWRKCCHVNPTYLPYKIHYIFIFGAFSGVIPFLPVLAKELGITASAVGIAFSILPFCNFLTKSCIGVLSDYFRSIKVFLISLLVLTSCCYLSILFIRPIYQDTRENMQVEVKFQNHSVPPVKLPLIYERSCMKIHFQNTSTCTLMLDGSTVSVNNDSICRFADGISVEPVFAKNLKHFRLRKDEITKRLDTESYDKFRLILYTNDLFLENGTCKDIKWNTSSLVCEPNVDHCLWPDKLEMFSVYETYQFWVYTLLAIIAGASAAACMSLSDVACYEILGDQREYYGRQRLWGTISWGVVCTLTGIFNDIATSRSERRDFSPGFYLMLSFIFIDVGLLTRLNLAKTKFSSNMLKDFGKILSSGEIIVFAVGVYIIGAMQAIIQTYEFWYLEDMGASQTLLGLTVAMQCLAGEVPFLFYSGWFVKKFGHFLCIAGSFFGFAIRLGLYSVIRDPWLALPIDVLHGLTFGLFHGAMTSFASVKSPIGMEATMLGIFGGLSDGLGFGTGSFIGGIGLDKIGGRRTFLSASIVSLICIPTLAAAPMIIRKLSSEDKVKVILDSKEVPDVYTVSQ